MLKFSPIILAVLYGLIMYRFSAWRLARELNTKSTELADPILGVLMGDMAMALGLDRIRVHIYEIDPINGLAAPDGRIFITRGFYNKYRASDVSAEEMASVIAHELGHVALGHSRRRMIDFSGQNALRTALALVLSRFLPGIGVLIAGALTTMLAARLSRSDEYEADAYRTPDRRRSAADQGRDRNRRAKSAVFQTRTPDRRRHVGPARLADEPPENRRPGRGDRKARGQYRQSPPTRSGRSNSFCLLINFIVLQILRR